MNHSKEDMIVLLRKLHAIQKEVDYLQKDMNVAGQYNGLKEEKATSAFSAAFNKHGIICQPVAMNREQSIHNYTEQKEYKGKSYTVHKQRNTTSVDVTYRLYCIETGASVDFVSCGTGIDSQDKASGMAMTYAFKNGLLRSFCVATGDDTDRTHSKDIESETKPHFTAADGIQLKADLDAGKPLDGIKVWLDGFYIFPKKIESINKLNSELLK